MISAVPIHQYLGKTFGPLQIYSLAGRDEQNLPVWLCRCTECKSTGIRLEHRKISQGNVRCPASIHGKPMIRAGTTSVAGVQCGGTAGSARSEASRAAFDLSQPPQARPLPDYEMRRRDALRLEEQRRWEAQQQRIAEEFQRYRRCALIEWGIPLEKMPSLDLWYAIGDTGRERLMAAVDKEQKQ